MGFHRLISEVLDWLCRMDQVDVTNLVGAECLSREYPLIEDLKVPPAAGASDEHAYFRGQRKKMHGACVSPELSAWVAARLQRDNELLKQRRKAQERGGLTAAAPGGKKN